MAIISFAKSRVDHSELSGAVVWPVPLWSMSTMVRSVNSLRTESHPWWSSPLPWISTSGALDDGTFFMEYQSLSLLGNVTSISRLLGNYGTQLS